MASFTFEAGNTRALLRLPLYALGVLASLVVPRTNRVWVVGCGIGVGEGAQPLYELARRRLGPRVRVVWLATTERELADARARDFDAVRKSGWRGFWLTLRARVLVVTHGAGDLNRYGTRGGFLVQLWHGIPVKRLHLDSPVARTTLVGSALIGRLAGHVVARGYRIAGARINLFPAASERVVGRIASAFGIAPDRIAVTGDPRDDVLLAGEPADRERHARALLETHFGPLPERIVLYAPTWRDGDPDPGIPDEPTWRQLDAWLRQHDAALVVRVHPLGRGDYAAGARISSRVHVLDARMQSDLNPVLNAVDVLVTDYSSAAFDFALIDGPTVFFAPDVTEYLRRRGLYEPYALFSGRQHVVTWRGVLRRLDAVLARDPATEAHTRWLRDEHFDFVDAGATERVLAEIRRRLGDDVPLAPPRARPQVESASFDGDRFVVRLADPVSSAYLSGPRARIAGAVDGTVVSFALRGERWGRPGLALPTGNYRLVLGDAPSTTRIRLPDSLPATTTDAFRATVAGADGALVLRIRPPVDRIGPVGYRRSRPELDDAVYFESFYGRTAGDNPLGIDRALARRQPNLRRYWGVVDGSIAVPDGAVRLIVGSERWWEVRAAARVLIVNDWLRWAYRRRPHQHVLQTWHGTMLKRLALDRPDTNPRRRMAVVREQSRWNALLSQNPYSSAIFRSAYAMRGPIWETGYPRNDVLSDPTRAAFVRATVGIPDGVRVVLYAPTWRDDRLDLVEQVDLHPLVRRLPDDYIVLVRGHSRTLRSARDVRGTKLVDVTSYPDAADLMLIADVLVTDYSSVMFDFAATGKPIVFHVPDRDHYSRSLRGLYFDLLAEAPGPVVDTLDDLAEALADPRVDTARYAGWRDRFVPWDDGKAGDRVVDRLYESSWLI